MTAMEKMTTEERIQEYFNTHWTFKDFIQAYIWAYDIDPDALDDPGFRQKIEKAVDEKLSPDVLRSLQEAVIADINERLFAAML
ncbi:MAG: hypothetical protein Q4D71_07260 [Oscillospiraceae bacterium]|nr:hypothetical protein [Oscillospiraceae bacterium]